jgi:short subunit dehydrogenase-like uncharacterized protein
MSALPSVASRSSRRFDLVLFGATGFTGRLVADYLAKHYASGLTWAIGGRNRAKLERVREALGIADLAVVVADSSDRASLDTIAIDTRVVVSTVGPYALHGRELVAACVAAGTDYCDLTGETPFIRDMIDQHHARARATGARIVHCCGYDSIPSDLGTLMVQEHAKKAHGVRCGRVKYFAVETKGGMSGGTIASMLGLVEEASKDRRVRRILFDPYALVPDHEGPGPDGPDQRGVHYDADLGRWTGPFLMAAINTRVVRRTNALLGYAYGKDFRYSEAMSFGKGPSGWLTAMGVTAGMAGFAGVVGVPPLRSLAKRALPGPGEGPSKKARDGGRFTSQLVGLADGVHVIGTVKGRSDPGYGETSKMLSESAVCLANDPGISREGGVLTPASCMGMRLVERLRDAGMTFDVTG